MTTNDVLKRRPLVVEMIGPTGVGKSTLVRELQQFNSMIQAGIHLSKPESLPFYVGNTLPWLPTYLLHHRSERWFSRKEIRSMVYLDAWRQVLGRQRIQDSQITVLEHGPIFSLARLREFGPGMTRSQRFQCWWNEMIEQWAQILDVIVWLDAPDEILHERIQSRHQNHAVKGKPAFEVHLFLERYRKTFEEIVVKMNAVNYQTVLHLDTARTPSDQLAEELLAAFHERIKPGSSLTGRDNRL